MKLEINASPVFGRIWKSNKRIMVLRGGTGSTKTYSMCQILANWLVTGRLTEDFFLEIGVASVVRRYSATTRTSVYRDFRNVLSAMGASGVVEHSKTGREFRYQGRLVEFFGADDEEKLKGPRRDILYVNEAPELTFGAFTQLAFRTHHRIFIDLNPDDEDGWVNTEIEQKRAMKDRDVLVDVSTYRDNPFLTDAEVKEIERLRDLDPMLWQIYGLGQYGRLEGLVFSNTEGIEVIPDTAEFIARGLDFGFTNDPTALIALYRHDGKLILDEEIYETELLNSDIDRKMKDIGVRSHEDIWADSAEPKSITELSLMGYSIFAVEKGADSVIFGLNLMKQYTIAITDRSTNLKKEFRKYIWKKDRNGKSLNIPIDSWNHGIDAARYAVMMALGKKRSASFRWIE
jgi:phage terminase large subunit